MECYIATAQAKGGCSDLKGIVQCYAGQTETGQPRLLILEEQNSPATNYYNPKFHSAVLWSAVNDTCFYIRLYMRCIFYTSSSGEIVVLNKA